VRRQRRNQQKSECDHLQKNGIIRTQAGQKAAVSVRVIEDAVDSNG